jgi:hypothetical protein
MRHVGIVAGLAAFVTLPAFADPGNGWRGNGTGQYPDTKAPLEWSRIPRGVASDIRTRATKAEPAGDGAPLEKGMVRDWLVLGPFPVKDSVAEFDKAQLSGEADVQPAEGDKVGELSWKKLASNLDDPFAFGPAGAPFTDVAAAVGGFKPNQIAYVHAYLYSLKGGTVRAVVEHGHGMKAWVNGKQVYGSANRGFGMGNYYAYSRVELSIYPLEESPRFDIELKPGWNRLLLKIGTFNKVGWTDQQFLMRIMDLPNIPYETKNIVWMTELPHRSNSTPIVVGDRIFLMAEPDELLCLDRASGKVLWTAANSYYEALTPEDHQAKPELRAKIDPLLAEVRAEKDFVKRMKLRVKLQLVLAGLDERLKWKCNGHFEAHFGIVGFTSPSPISDGKHVWVWCGNGVAACYDLEGKRRWITRVPAKDLAYASAPALADGVFTVFLQHLVGLDAETGKIRWEQPKIRDNYGTLLAATIAKTPVIVANRNIVRARDGHALFLEANLGGTWTSGVVKGDVLFAPGYGIKQVHALDFAAAEGDSWKPRREVVHAKRVGRLPNGTTADRASAASPLIVDDIAYMIDIYGAFYAYDFKGKDFLYQKDTGMRGLFHYNAMPVVASPTLLGRHIVVQDNQGTAVVLQPGKEYREVRKNRIATQLDRYWPIPAQETLTYAPIVADDTRAYIRGERYLYCIGEK